MTINDGITDHEQYAAACRYQNGFLGRVDPITAFMAGAEWARARLAAQFEKAEQERDEARARLAEAAAEIRAQGETIAELAAEPHPLTPDANARNVVDFLATALTNLGNEDRDYLARILAKGAR